MKNLMSRDEYLHSLEEGFIKDTIKKGIDKVKSFFKIGFKKIKNFIVTFDENFHALPVVSLQATIDRVVELTGVEVYAPAWISDIAVEAGGNGCSEKAPLRNDDEIYDEGPDGEDYVDWLESKKYKDSVEYQNMLTMGTMLNEHYGLTYDKNKEVFENKIDESWDAIKDKRVTYVDEKELSCIPEIDYDEFEEILNDLISERQQYGGKNVMTSDGVEVELERNILIFGAPGIGKSSIPNAVIKKYNETVANNDPSKMISLISINCGLLEEGGLMMPTMPKEIDIVDAMKKFSDTFPQADKFLENLDDEQTEKIAKSMSGMSFQVKDAPKTWLPMYNPVGGEIDVLQDAYANGGVYKDKEGCNIKTGCGGIILLDEFLRADPRVFSQLMNFFLERKLQDWELGSKWVIIACSNRPQDDGEVAEKWGTWNDSVATKDRMATMYQLTPDPEQWLKWVRSKKIADELLLEFIFNKKDEKAMAGKEFARWHSMVRNGTGDSKQTLPITPRRWVSVFGKLKKYEDMHGYKDISEMSKEEILKVLKGSFDKDFVEEIRSWLRDHMDKVDLDGIIKNPKEVYLPQKFIDDPTKAGIIIDNLFRQFEARYKDNMEDLSDDDFANIIAWLGINYKNDMYQVQQFINLCSETMLKSESEYQLARYIHAYQMLLAAFPQKDLDDDLAYLEQPSKHNKYPWPENSLDILKDLMREYFPWRIDGDEIKYYDKIKTSDEN